ncbi:MAG: hypothetical protein GY696_34290 [Gammaproteobacteria bacterium]|nr:hypothetical protein [Gammaproteobacteria bacterium]
MSEVGHQMTEMLVDCTLQGFQCLPSNFERWEHGTYGNCFTYFVNNTEFPSYVGQPMGLSMTLFIQPDLYLPLVSASSGLRVNRAVAGKGGGL